MKPLVRPRALSPGARVSLVAPAGPLSAEAVDLALQRVRGWGWQPVLGRHARLRAGYLAGTDAQRLADLNEALRSHENDAIWCLRGGYGTMRIVDGADWAALAARPRPIIGFSDNTVLHLAAARAGVISFHAPHPAAEDLPPFAERGLMQALTEPRAAGELPLPAGMTEPYTVVGGAAEGRLVGGNLVLVCATLGTPYEVRPEGGILLLEEVGEKLYRLDRLLSQLRLAGVFDRVAAVAVGALSECPDEGSDGMPSVADVVRDLLGGLSVPVLAGLPFGHIDANWTLPIGVRARLDADARTLTLLEPAVSDAVGPTE